MDGEEQTISAVHRANFSSVIGGGLRASGEGVTRRARTRGLLISRLLGPAMAGVPARGVARRCDSGGGGLRSCPITAVSPTSAAAEITSTPSNL